MTMGTSGCYMLNAVMPADGSSPISVPGAFGQVEGGILPGLTGYEMGQAAMGDAFAWLSQLTNTPLKELAAKAAALPVATGQEELALDWINGCRSPHNDSTLRGVIGGVSMSTTPEALYRATAAGIACGGRDILESFTGAGVPVDRIVATGGLPHAAPDLIQTFADVSAYLSSSDAIDVHSLYSLPDIPCTLA
jgi:L-ribulokinase